jgi:hypothetical protein
VTVTGSITPRVSRLALSPSTFRAAASGSSARKQRTGTRVSYRLNENAGVRFRVERLGRAKHSRHKRYLKVRGSFSMVGKAGSNHFRFSGRIAHKKLATGRYRLVAVAKSREGHSSKAVRHKFRIVS